jgi:hypothetical protein
MHPGLSRNNSGQAFFLFLDAQQAKVKAKNSSS